MQQQYPHGSPGMITPFTTTPSPSMSPMMPQTVYPQQTFYTGLPSQPLTYVPVSVHPPTLQQLPPPMQFMPPTQMPIMPMHQQFQPQQFGSPQVQHFESPKPPKQKEITFQSLIKRVDREESLKSLSLMPHDAQIWLNELRKRKQAQDHGAVKSLRRLIIQQTIEATNQGQYKASDGSSVQLGKHFAMQSKQRNNNYAYDEFDLPSKLRDALPLYDRTVVSVENRDSIDMGIRLKSFGFNPVVLNMANAHKAGGGYLHGAGAQEESLFRRSNYHEFLDGSERGKLYPIPEFGGIYSSNVLVFRKSEAEGYEFTEPIFMSFIAVAAYNKPQLTHQNRLRDNDAYNTKKKIRAILRIALVHNHDSIVLGAFGCGAFGNPAEHMACLMKEVLLEREFAGRFKAIAFAVIDDSNAFNSNRGGNYSAFKKVLMS